MSVYKKLLEAKKEIGKISKDSKNPFFKSNYLSLNGLIDAIDDVLNKHELLLLQPIKDGKVITQILDIEKDGGAVQSEMVLPNITDPQKLGSAITYFRRYTLESLLGLKADDDDGNLASKKEPVKPRDFRSVFKVLETAKDIAELKNIWLSLDPESQSNKDVISKKDEMYKKLNAK